MNINRDLKCECEAKAIFSVKIKYSVVLCIFIEMTVAHAYVGSKLVQL